MSHLRRFNSKFPYLAMFDGNIRIFSWQNQPNVVPRIPILKPHSRWLNPHSCWSNLPFLLMKCLFLMVNSPASAPAQVVEGLARNFRVQQRDQVRGSSPTIMMLGPLEWFWWYWIIITVSWSPISVIYVYNICNICIYIYYMYMYIFTYII